MNAHPAGPRHADEIHHGDVPPRPQGPAESLALAPKVWPRNVVRGGDGVVRIAGVAVTDLAIRYGTPLFIVDEDDFRSRCREMATAFGGGRNVHYAAKAFLCSEVAHWVAEENLSMDVASGGELAVALRAGFPADRIALHGNNKSLTELRAAVEAGVGCVVVDSLTEIDRLEVVAAEAGRTQDVMVRVTVGVEAHTHEFIATGQDDSKFGFNLGNGDAMRAVERAASSPSVRLVGLHCHIGSNVFAASSFGKAAEVMANFAMPLGLPELVLGGGLGVAYVESEEAPTITQWGNVLRDAVDALGVRANVSVEPGRSIVAAAAMTVYEVGTIKDIPGIRTYVAVDGGMSDNPRPTLYGSGYEAFLPRAPFADRPKSARVVGKHCE
ncbi:MAG: diaminopimelate decarboxylase, partial [Mycobacterium sp.]|nr:diaminopimelate decarboxylase [Mycobacterium sp.]